MRHLTAPIGSAGAVVTVWIGLSSARRRVLQRHARAEPPPVQVSLLIDTGASNTLLDEQVMRTLQLTPTGSTKYHSSSTNGVAKTCDVYDVRLILGGVATPLTLTIDPLDVITTAFINHPYEGLLGRDVLSRLQLGWNGPTQSLDIAYP